MNRRRQWAVNRKRWKRCIRGLSIAVLLATGACLSDEDVPETERVTGERLGEALADQGVFVLDVRRPDEIQRLGTVEGSTNIPIEELEHRLDELPRDRPILTA